jgi:hypothetical protein
MDSMPPWVRSDRQEGVSFKAWRLTGEGNGINAPIPWQVKSPLKYLSDVEATLHMFIRERRLIPPGHPPFYGRTNDL